MKNNILIGIGVASLIGMVIAWPSLVKSPAFAGLVGGPTMYKTISGNHAAIDLCSKELPDSFSDQELDDCYRRNRSKF